MHLFNVLWIYRNCYKQSLHEYTRLVPMCEIFNMQNMSKHSASFQIIVFSRFCYVLLCNRYLVYGSGNINIHRCIRRRNKTEGKLII